MNGSTKYATEKAKSRVGGALSQNPVILILLIGQDQLRMRYPGSVGRQAHKSGSRCDGGCWGGATHCVNIAIKSAASTVFTLYASQL